LAVYNQNDNLLTEVDLTGFNDTFEVTLPSAGFYYIVLQNGPTIQYNLNVW